MQYKSRIEVALLTLLLISAAFGGVLISIAGAETQGQSPFLMAVHLRSHYYVDPHGTESWGHEVIFQVGDPDGVDNLFINDEVSFSILAPDGNTHPLPGEHVEVAFVEGEPTTLSILWYTGFPVFGEYTITVWDADGLSVTYTTLPTNIEDVPTIVPTIIYPPNFGIIYETVPTFTWETYVPDKGYVMWYKVDVYGDGWNWVSWPNVIPPDETSAVFNFDGSSPVSELPPGHYRLSVSVDIQQELVYEADRYIESIDFEYRFAEYRGAEAGRSHIFTVAPKLFNVNIDIDPDTLNLRSEGQWITAYIELPEGYDAGDIDISTVVLNGEIPAELHPTEIGDYDTDGIIDLMVKFDRASIIELLDTGEVTLTITGEVDGTPFEGNDTIKVIGK